MYIDLDLHHGDGVADAFKFSDSVLTFSLHRLDQGFFPGTGKTPKSGFGKGRGKEINFPTLKGLSDDSFRWVLQNVVDELINRFEPECLVVQCGGDGLCSDSDFNEWNVTVKGYGSALLELVERYGRPCLFVGGGGYNSLETSKLWCYLTGLMVGGLELCNDWDLIPDSVDEELIGFQEFEFWRYDKASNMKDSNTEEYLSSVRDKILK
ncbi:unnamed protein product [Ambrosiozyma monospora]|uniref:Unnamed protein product n=1 Tax=Ambrosiozyma monospora TaxID=43982 RepID=A0ACB5T7C7_AMBMO|nr:unnamed protein product [Ambrosiozyma monospora]